MKYTKIIMAMAVAVTGTLAMSGCKLSNHKSYDELVEEMVDRSGSVEIGGKRFADRCTKGGASFDGQRIKKLEIDWYRDSVSIVAYDGNEVVISEVSDGQLSDTTTMHHYLDADGTLTIMFGKPGVKMKNQDLPNKHLLVKVPRVSRLSGIEMNGMGYGLRMDSIVCDEMEMNSVSDKIVLNECTMESLEVNEVSTSLEATFSRMPDDIELNAATMDAVLYVPKNAGIRLEMNGMNHSFDSELPVLTKGGVNIIGDGDCDIECNAMGGSLRIAVKAGDPRGQRTAAGN